MVAFTDSQLRAVWAAADRVPFEKRGVFIERVVARLRLHRGFTDADLDDAVRVTLTGLIQRRPDPADASRRSVEEQATCFSRRSIRRCFGLVAHRSSRLS